MSVLVSLIDSLKSITPVTNSPPCHTISSLNKSSISFNSPLLHTFSINLVTEFKFSVFRHIVVLIYVAFKVSD